MTENEALGMLQAKLTCMELELLSSIEKGCDNDCDACEYCYAQGTVGEQKKALEMAIKALSEIQQYRAIGTVEEFKALKENQFFNFDSPVARIDKKSYDKAIDDFAERLKESLLNNWRHFLRTDSYGFDWITTDAVHTHIDELLKRMKGENE